MWTDDDVVEESWTDDDVAEPERPKPRSLQNIVETGPTGISGRKLLKSVKRAAREMATQSSQYPRDSQGAGYDLAGDVLATAIPAAVGGSMAARMLPKAAGLIPGLARSSAAGAGGSAAAAAAMGQDVSDAAVGGAILGPAFKLVGNLGSKAYKGISRLTEDATARTGRELQHLFGDRTPAAVNALQSLKPSVPGERVTAGMAASPMLPEFKAIEQGARSRPGANRLLEIDAQNEAARLAAIEKYAAPGRPGVASGPGARVPQSKLETIRERKTGPLYEEAFKDRLPLSNNARQVITGSEVLPLNLKGAKAFDQNVRNLQAAGRPVPGGAAVNKKMVSIEQLQNVKDQLSGKIRQLDKATDSVSIAERNRLQEARRILTDEMKKASPNYAKANDAYAKLMVPQNQSNVAQQLVNVLRGSSGTERAGPFLEAMKNAPRTIQKAGAPRYTQIEQIASPQQLKAYQQVQQSLLRQEGYNKLKAPPGIAPDYMSPMETAARVSPRLFDQVVTTARAAAQFLGKKSDAEVQRILGDAVVDPAKMQALLQNVPAANRQKIIDAVDRMVNDPAVIGAMSGTMTTD